jgi:RNA polymerase sigma factor (sigma-70 family)
MWFCRIARAIRHSLYMHDLEIILKKSIAGKRKYQGQLYDRFSGMVYGICLRYAFDPFEAEDWFQEIFIKVFQSLRSVDKAEALPGWIKRIAINTCIDKVRAKTQEFVSSETLPETDDEKYTELLDRISEEQIVQLINELPEGYRLVFNMSVVDGFSHKEIAEQLEIAESTSRSQLTYAKRLLQQKLLQIGISKYESVI